MMKLILLGVLLATYAVVWCRSESPAYGAVAGFLAALSVLQFIGAIAVGCLGGWSFLGGLIMAALSLATAAGAAAMMHAPDKPWREW